MRLLLYLALGGVARPLPYQWALIYLGATMTPSTTHDLDLLTRRFKALSDPNRLRILDRLRGGEHCVCELTGVLDAGQSLLSFHLKTLKDAGLVKERPEGRWTHYALDPSALRAVSRFLGSLGTRAPERRWKAVCAE